MNKEQIIQIVNEVTGITYECMKLKRPIKVLFARYAAIIMMYEEGYPAVEIAKVMTGHRTSVYSAIKTISDLLETNNTFKKIYLECIAKITEQEEAA